LPRMEHGLPIGADPQRVEVSPQTQNETIL
jgi:hypothetical protein